MAKTEILNTRVDPEVKKEAILVLNKIGMPLSIAIDIYLKQIAFSKGIPFELTIPEDERIVYKENRRKFELKDAAKRKAIESIMWKQAEELNKGIEETGFGEEIEGEDFEEDEIQWQTVDG